jgi:hypothetical protein
MANTIVLKELLSGKKLLNENISLLDVQYGDYVEYGDYF